MNRRSIIPKRTIFLLLVALFVICGQVTIGQDSLVFKKAIFKARLRTTAISMDAGYLTAINDSAVQIGKKPKRPDSIFLKTLPSYHYSQIESLQLWRKDAVATGTVIGALVGAGIGAIIASQTGESSCEYCIEVASLVAGGVIAGLFLGGLGGAAIGSTNKITISIKGEKEKMRKAIKKVKKKTPYRGYDEGR